MMKSILRYFNSAAVVLLIVMFSIGAARAQTTNFSYQGTLVQASTLANGVYDFEFALYETGGTLIGAPIQRNGVLVSSGSFNVTLDFGEAAFPGADRLLEIRVKSPADPTYTTLTPRQPITSVPQTIRALKGTEADSLSCVLCVTDGQITSMSGSKLTGVVAIENGGTGSATKNFVDLTTGQIVDGTKLFTGSVSAPEFSAGVQFNLDGERILSNAGKNNLFAGVGAGSFNAIGIRNSFFGAFAGAFNTAGSENSFFGTSAGASNTTGGRNSFFGVFAGATNTGGFDNSFFGMSAGAFNTTGSDNSSFGADSGSLNTTGSSNSFFGSSAGYSNTTGSSNTFIGQSAGFSNTTGIDNSFVGANAGELNTTGESNSFFGVDAGKANTTGSGNSFFGTDAGRTNTTGFDNLFVGFGAGVLSTTGSSNTFVGKSAGSSNVFGSGNVFVGMDAGSLNTAGSNNSFVGRFAGQNNTIGAGNSFFGTSAGLSTTSGNNNAFFGLNAGALNTTANANSFFGSLSGRLTTTGTSNAFFGADSGKSNSTGTGNTFIGFTSGELSTTAGINTFVGSQAGRDTTTGGGNSFFGSFAGDRNATGKNNTIIGTFADVSGINWSFASAFGSYAEVSGNDTIVIGKVAGTYDGISRSADMVRIPGSLMVTGSISKGSGSFKIDHPLDPQNKYLSHSFVESPDMMNVYNGNIITNERGEATVGLPAYFQALNRDFRYQLTVIGQFAQAIIAEEIKGNSFVIRTDKPGVKVSWQVTGIRRDKFADDYRIPNSEDKPANERGKCLYAPLCESNPIKDVPDNP